MHLIFFLVYTSFLTVLCCISHDHFIQFPFSLQLPSCYRLYMLIFNAMRSRKKIPQYDLNSKVNITKTPLVLS